MRYFETIFLEEADEFVAGLDQKAARKVFYNVDLAEQLNDALPASASDVFLEGATNGFLAAGVTAGLTGFLDESLIDGQFHDAATSLRER